MKTRIAILAMLLPIVSAFPAAAVSQKSPEHKAVNPIGSYDVVFEMADGHPMASVLTIRTDQDGKLAGSLGLHDEALPLANVLLESNKLTFSVAAPHGRIGIQLVFDGVGNFKGEYTIDGATGTLKGTRRKA
jgi:hypothetical protein